MFSRQLVHALHHQVGDDAEPAARGLPVTVGVADDRGVEVRLRLDRRRVQLDLDLIAVACRPGHRLAAPQRADRLHALVHGLPVLAVHLRCQHEVPGVPAAGHADRHPSAGEVVHHGPLLGDPDRIVQRQHHAARVQPDPAGLGGDRGGQHRRVGEHAAEGVEVAFRQPHRVQPAAVGEASGGQDGRVLVPIAVVRVVAEEVQAEVRGRPADLGRGRLHQRRSWPRRRGSWAACGAARAQRWAGLAGSRRGAGRPPSCGRRR